MSDNWAAGDAVVGEGGDIVGGFAGAAMLGGADVSFARNWSAGAVAGGGSDSSGFLWGVENDLSGNVVTVSLSYWNADTSGVTTSQQGSVNLSVVLQTLSSVAFGGAAATAWAFGDSDLSEPTASPIFRC